MSISNAKNACDEGEKKDNIGGQNAQGAKGWPRQSNSFASVQAEGRAAVLALAQCLSGNSSPTGLSHLALADRAVEISQHPPGDRQAGDVSAPLSFHHPLIPVLGPAGLKTHHFP